MCTAIYDITANVTVRANPTWFATKLNIVLLPQFTDKLNICPYPVHHALNLTGLFF